MVDEGEGEAPAEPRPLRKMARREPRPPAHGTHASSERERSEMRKRATIAITIAAAISSGALESAALATEQLLVSSFFSDQVTRHSLPDCALIGTLQTGVGLDGALCARVGPDGLLYVASEGTDTIQRYNVESGAFIDTFVTAGSGGLDGPTGTTWNALGQLIVASLNNCMVPQYDGVTGASLGTLVTSGTNGLNGPDNGTIIGPDGDLYVPSYFQNRVLRFDGETGAPVGGAFIASIGRPRVL